MPSESTRHSHIYTSPHDFLSLDREELCSFFAESYKHVGFRGKEDFYHMLDESSRVVTLSTDDEFELCAAAILSGDRITKIATSTRIDLHGSRRNNLSDLFAQSRESNPNAWISIGLGYECVADAAAKAGYIKEMDCSRVERILNKIGAAAYYEINPDATIGRVRPDSQRMYYQNIWRSGSDV